MSMATVRFYKNRYYYPHYSNNIQAVGSAKQYTPVNMGLRTGTIRVAGSMDDFMNCNYLAITRSGRTLYAWIDDVSYRTANSFDVTYQVDAWRTYRSSVTLGTQFIERSNTVTYKRDDLLGSTKAYPDVVHRMQSIGDNNKRVLVVQTKNFVGEQLSNTPVQPTPHNFWFVEYDIHDWANNEVIGQFMNAITGGAEPTNIVTVYSVPYVDISHLPTRDLIVTYGGSDSYNVPGFKSLTQGQTMQLSTFVETEILLDHVDIDELLRVDHSVQLVVPDAGILNIPDYLLKESKLYLRQDVDIFSGASNYMIKSDTKYSAQSVRGSSISSIPIISDPMQTYISQNQNALATSLIGDVATVFGGLAMIGSQGAIGTGATLSGLNGIINRQAMIEDMANKTSNPPAFLGTALASFFNRQFWTIVTKQAVDNANQVHGNYGYPLNKAS